MGAARRLRAIGGRVRRLFIPAAAAAPAGPPSRTIDLNDPAISPDPFVTYEELRREGSAVYLERHGAWLVLGDAEAREVLSNSSIFSSAPWSFIDPVMLGADPPRHGAVRRVVSRAFGAETLRRIEGDARSSCAARVGPEFDAVRDLARPVSREVAAGLIGFEPMVVARLAESEGEPYSAGSFERVLATLDAVAEQAGLYRRFLGDGGGAIGPDEARSLVRLLWVASTATTERAIVRSILHLAEDEALQSRIRAEPALVPRFVEETIRLFPPEMILRRQTLRATTLGGAAIPADAQILVCLPAANRDPAVYASPAQISWERETPTMAFGSGPHTCVGGPLSRRIVAAALETLIERSRAFRLAIPADDLEFVHSMVAIAPLSVPLRVDLR